MKKIRMMALCMVLVLAFAGCSPIVNESPNWVKESAEKISGEIGSGEFVLDDVVYQFPMPLSDWLENGWSISNSYDNVDEFRLEPNAESTTFELFNEEDAFVRVTVLNNTYEAAPVDECIVNYLYMSSGEVDVVLPQGVSKRDKPAKVFETYGEPDVKDEKSGSVKATYNFSDDNFGPCYVELSMADNDYTIDPLTSIKYGTIGFGNYWDALVKSEGKDGACKVYFDVSMEASIHGNLDAYVDYGIASKDMTEEIYNNEMQYFAEVLLYYLDMDSATLSDKDRNRVVQVAKDVLAKTKWEVKDVQVNTFDQGKMTVALYPTNIFEVIENDLVEAGSGFYEKYIDVDFENMSEEEYAVIDAEYNELMISVLEKNAANAGCKDAVIKTYDINAGDGVLSEKEWMDIDDTIMDLLAEEE